MKQLLVQAQCEDRLALLRQARGMWKDRPDLPAIADVRGGVGPQVEGMTMANQIPIDTDILVDDVRGEG